MINDGIQIDFICTHRPCKHPYWPVWRFIPPDLWTHPDDFCGYRKLRRQQFSALKVLFKKIVIVNTSILVHLSVRLFVRPYSCNTSDDKCFLLILLTAHKVRLTDGRTD